MMVMVGLWEPFPRPGPACGVVSNATAGTVHQHGINEVANNAVPQWQALASAWHGMQSEFPNQNIGHAAVKFHPTPVHPETR